MENPRGFLKKAEDSMKNKRQGKNQGKKQKIMQGDIPGYRKNMIRILSVFFLIFPWITYLKILEYGESESQIFSSYEGIAVDFFLYYKEVILMIMAAVAVLWFIGNSG